MSQLNNEKVKQNHLTQNMITFIIIFFILCIFITVFLIIKDNSDEINNTVALENKSSEVISSNLSLKSLNETYPNRTNDTELNISNEENTYNNENTTNTSASIDEKTIVIDPGHQIKGNLEKEPIGPGSTTTKAKVTGGATGVSTGQNEYELNLTVALKLKDALEKKGYNVIMTRTSNNVNISNSERAKIANNANADAFVRIHANSANSSSAKGVLTMCQTIDNIYNGNIADKSYKLSKSILDGVVSKTGALNKGVTRTDEMSGINWCEVPSTILEMGFLSNSEEDKLLADDSYQNKIVEGIVNGLENYFNS